MTFTGKRVLVTGAGTGIGREIALAFCRAGANVVFHYSHSRAGAEAAIDEARRTGGGLAFALEADFREVEAVRDLARRAIDVLGGLEVLVNNAGITFNRPLAEITPEQFDTLYAVNIRAMFFTIQAVVPAMRAAGGGTAINLTSVHALEGMREHAAYAATKGAIVAMTRALAVELAPEGIRVNAIAPGAIEVENYARAMPGYDAAALGQTIPCGFLGQPADIAAAALFLASDAARYIVGQTLVIDGGTTAWMPFSDAFRRPLGGQFGRGYVPGT